MSVIATAVRHLMAAGVTGDALCDAIAEMEATIRAEPKPRSAGAIRQERYREAKRNNASQNVTGDACDNQESAPLSAPPNDIYSNPPHHTPKTQTGRDPFPKPDWASAQIWRDLKTNRKSKKLANTATAHRQFVNAVLGMADDEWPPGRLLEAIVAKGWGGAHDPRQDGKINHGNNFSKSGSNGPDKRSGLARAIDAQLAGQVSSFP